MQWLAELSVRKPVLASVLIIFCCVVGVAAYAQLGVDRFPKIDFPTVVVVTRLPGAAPEEMETEVTTRIEEAVNTVSGIDELSSITNEGVSQVIIQFVLEKDIDVAVQEVRDRINQVIPFLPNNTDTPLVQKFDPDSDPVIVLSLDAPRPIRELTEYADRTVRPLLEMVQGVGQVSIIGGRKRQVNIWLDPVRMRAAQVSAADIQHAVSAQNLMLPSGNVESGPERLTLRLRSRVDQVEEMGAFVVAERAGRSIHLRDVARVEDGEEEMETVASRDGQPAVLLTIRKQSGENSVAMVDAVMERLEELRKSLPAGYSLQVVRDNTAATRTSVHAVEEHLLLGGLFAALVVLLFLGDWRSTLIAALAIPTSIISTFALMWLKGFTLNTISLLALALAVGIVIDDAIVVLENIFRFIHEKRHPPMEAAILATREIGLAVLATTLSLIVVFLPVTFMGGVPGRFLSNFGWTMAFSIAVSLLVAFTITPLLSARWLTGALAPEGGPRRKRLLERFTDTFYLPLERLYERSLRWVLAHRWVVVLSTLALFGSCAPLMQAVPKGFLPKSDEAQFQMSLRMPEGTSVASTHSVAERISRQVRELPEVRSTLVTIGDSTDRAPNLATVLVQLSAPGERSASQDEVMDRVRREIISKLSKEVRISVSEVPLFGGGPAQAAVMFSVTGPDFEELIRHSQILLEKLRTIPGAVDVDSNLVLGKPEIDAYIDRERAADLGVQVADVAASLQLLVGGMDVSTFVEKGNRYDVRLRAEPGVRDSLESLAQLTVPSARFGPVPLLDVVRLQRGDGPSQVNRLNRRRQVMLYANTAPGVAAGDVADAFARIAEDYKGQLPSGFDVLRAGTSREISRTARNFAFVLVLSLVSMYLILAAQFESWLHPITILLSLPLTVPFALVSLLLFGQALDIYSMVGLLVLFGVVKKNSILQIDHTNQLRREGLPRQEAIVRGSRDRLRPILMTTLSFVAGMVPLVL
ncbi:MAG TPA: efflux RND transporter permease subunit, partial [Myxococcaceae bacterium]|nr:efflux RND transporter permease subunit [Myxococcaceae bacterium]